MGELSPECLLVWLKGLIDETFYRIGTDLYISAGKVQEFIELIDAERDKSYPKSDTKPIATVTSISSRQNSSQEKPEKKSWQDRTKKSTEENPDLPSH